MLGVILAGGLSTRMGADKAMVQLAGHPLVFWVWQALSPTTEEVVVAGREECMGLPCLADPPSKGRGPLAGIAAALRFGQPVLAVAVDQPWIRRETLEHLTRDGGELAVVPVDDGVRQTTCAYFPAGLAGLADRELNGGGSLQSLLDLAGFEPVTHTTWSQWGEDGRSWFSVDTPEDLETGLARYGPPPAAQPPM